MVGIEDMTKWRLASDRRDRNERDRTKRRREKLIKVMDVSIGAMLRYSPEHEEIRDLLIYSARETQSAIDKREEALAEIEAQEYDAIER